VNHHRPTEQQLAEIEARANAATTGPWCTDGAEIYRGTEYEPGISQWVGETCRPDESDGGRADATFAAAARTDVPTLLAEIRRLCTVNAQARSLHQPIAGDGGPYCQTCTQEEQQPPPIGWWVPFPCPTAQTLDGAASAGRADAARSTDTHVVADDSDDPEHVDDCPGCEAFTLAGHTTAVSAATPATERPVKRCTCCTHPKGDHDGRADHRARHSPLVAGDPWCHACNAACDYAAPTP
jgi:hypothetical protein